MDPRDPKPRATIRAATSRTRSIDRLVGAGLILLAVAAGSVPSWTSESERSRSRAVDAHDELLRWMDRNGARVEGSSPRSLEADIVIPAPGGADREGRARWARGRDGRWRSDLVFSDGSFFREGSTGAVRWSHRSESFAPLTIAFVHSQWGRSRPDGIDDPTGASIDVRRKVVTKLVDGRPNRCIRFRFSTADRWNDLCTEADTGALTTETRRDESFVAHVRFDPPTAASGGLAPGGFAVTVNGREVVRVKDVTRVALDPEAVVTFEPPHEARTGPLCTTYREPERILSYGNRPDYRGRVRAFERDGRVVLGVRIDTAGHVDEVEVLKLSGSDEFGQAAVKALRTWRYRPALCDGMPMEVETIATVEFF